MEFSIVIFFSVFFILIIFSFCYYDYFLSPYIKKIISFSQLKNINKKNGLLIKPTIIKIQIKELISMSAFIIMLK